MSDIVGIDLGATNSLIGVMDSGFPILLADENGSRLTPSVVHLDERDQWIVGATADRMRVLQPGRTIYSIKRLMGRRPGESEKDDFTSISRSFSRGSVYHRDRRAWFRPEQLSGLILTKLKYDAERVLGHEVDRAVITVPAYFNELQRQATKRAGELAGLTVERIINEPTAAALAYGLERLTDRSHVAVYDLGGGTFDISILELNEGAFRVRSTNGNTRLGGDDIDRELIRLLKERVIARYPELRRDLEEPQSLARLREIARNAKIRLSSEEVVPVEIPFLAPSQSFSYMLTRQELEALVRPLIRKTRSHCLRSLEDANLRLSRSTKSSWSVASLGCPWFDRSWPRFFSVCPTSVRTPTKRSP